jgi:hypothetical protein
MGAAIRESEKISKSILARLRTFLLTSYTQKCKERDGNRCVLTKLARPEAAHIFPYSMLNTPPPNKAQKTSTKTDKIWTVLHLFWDKDQINKWRRKIFPNPEYPNTSVDEPFNLICLSPNAHDMWNGGVFALKPLELSDDNTELTVQFFWQVPNKYQPESRIDLLTEPASSKGLDCSGDSWLTYKDSLSAHYINIHSGQVFTFKTTDPEKLPLPSVELLEMQWYLQRLVAMSGATDWPSLVWDDDDDDNIIPCPNPSYADGNMNTTSHDVYEWIPSLLPPLNSEPDVATYITPVECV